MHPRHVAFVGAIGITIGWLLASTVSPPVARVQSRPPERPPAPAIADAPQDISQVQLGARPQAPMPEGRRNPFVFAPRGGHEVSPDAPRIQAAQAEPAAAPPAPLGPAFVLSGIGIKGDARTAVLTTTGADIHLVTVNDTIDGFTVEEISESSVTLARDGARFVLRFPQ
jgi:hypothetical protein